MDNVPFTTDERAVWNVLQLRAGKAAAISATGLMEAARRSDGERFTERDIKGVIEDLRRRHRLKIGANRGKPHGYYVIVTAEELDESVRALRNQGIKMLWTAALLEGRDGKNYLRELLGQMELEPLSEPRQ